MRASFLTAALLTLGGASTVAHAVPGSHEHAASERERGSTCTTEHGAPKALEVSTSASAAERGPVELGRLLDELNAATEAARQDAEEKRAEAERAAAVLRALETDLARVEALLVESMAEARGAEEQPALQGIGYADDETSGAVRLRLVDLSDSGAPALVPVDVREPAPAAEDRGFMGVTVRDGDDGVTVSSVVDGSPAEAAGLQAEDVLFNIGGASVVDMDGLIEAMSAYAAGDTVVVGIMRGKKPMRRRVTLGSQGATRVAAPSTGAPTEGAPLDLREVSEEIVLKVEMEDPRRDGARRLRLIRSDADGGAIIAIAGELDGEIIAQEIEIEFADGDEDCCGECDGHEDGDCCGECEDHEHEDCCGECGGHEDEDCCGECEDHEHEDCCGECDGHEGDDCCGECEDHEHEDCCGECDGHEDDDCCGECEDHEHEDCCGECDDHEDDDCCGECGGHEHEDCCGECGHDALPEGYEEIFERRETRSVHDGNEEAEVFVRRERRPAWGGHGEGHDHRDGVGPEIEELHLRIERLQRELEELTEALLDVRREMDRRGRR